MDKLFGWTGKILQVNLSNNSTNEISTLPYISRFIGGRGIASRLYWENMDTDTGAFDPGNHLYFMNGPLAATRAPAASRWIVLGKSPMAEPEQFASGNLGGRLGAALKWAGLDGLDIVGAASKPVILVIEPGRQCRCEDASQLWGKDAQETISILEKQFGEKACVAAIGTAGEKKIRFATIMSSHGASATKGFGAVMGAKMLKAVVVKADGASFPAARPDALKDVTRQITSLWKGESSSRFWPELMIDDVELVEQVPCSGCPGICRRAIYRHSNGDQGYRKTCVSAFYYSQQELDKTGRMADATFHATQLANRHGLCILELRFLVTWLPEAMKRGLVDHQTYGLDPEELGSSQWVETLINLILSRKGLGDILAEGSRRSARELGAEDLLEGLVTKSGFDANYYSPRLFINNAPIYATESVYPITQLHRVSFPMVKWMIWMGTEGMMGSLTTDKLRHLADQFWGDTKAAEFDTPEKKGAAAAINQNRSTAMENMIFCDWFWPIDFSGNVESGVGDPSLEARLFTAVTGTEMDASDYLRSGERCVNLCRAIHLREGRRGRKDDVLEAFNFTHPLQKQDPPIGLFNPEYLMPGKNGELFTRKGSTVKRDVFDQVMDDYYRARGWDPTTGLFRKKELNSLGLSDLIPELEAKGFVAS